MIGYAIMLALIIQDILMNTGIISNSAKMCNLPPKLSYAECQRFEELSHQLFLDVARGTSLRLEVLGMKTK